MSQKSNEVFDHAEEGGSRNLADPKGIRWVAAERANDIRLKRGYDRQRPALWDLMGGSCSGAPQRLHCTIQDGAQGRRKACGSVTIPAGGFQRPQVERAVGD